MASWVVFWGSALIAFSFTWLSIRLSLERGWVDFPNSRSLHCAPTPRIGGLGIVAAFSFSTLGVWVFKPYGDSGFAANGRPELAMFGAASVLALVGLYDDLRDLTAGMKFTFEVLAALAVVTAGIYFDPFLFLPSVASTYLSILITLFWLTGFCNVFNFMDGVNGLSAGTGLIYGLAFFLLALRQGEPGMALLSILLGGSCLGFLFLNFPRARTFMGDTGSLFLGFLFALLIVRLARRGTDLVALGLIVCVFLFDGAFTLTRRICKRENIFQAHRSHLYQRLVQAGPSQSQVTSLYLLLETLTASLALVYGNASESARLLILLFVGLLLLLLPLSVFSVERRAARMKASAAHARQTG